MKKNLPVAALLAALLLFSLATPLLADPSGGGSDLCDHRSDPECWKPPAYGGYGSHDLVSRLFLTALRLVGMLRI